MKCDDVKSDCCGQKCLQSIIEKLAVYEDNGQTPEEQAKMIAYVGNDMESNALLLAKVHNLRAELKRVKAERDAAVNDLRDNADRPCYVCAKRINGRCTLPPPKDCAGFFRWEWRGLQKEEPNA